MRRWWAEFIGPFDVTVTLVILGVIGLIATAVTAIIHFAISLH